MEDVDIEEAYDMAGVYPTMNNAHPFSTLWAFHLEHAGDRWCVAGRFATVPLRPTVLDIGKLNLAKGKEYHVFDFWKQEYLGIHTDVIHCRALELGECQILGIREVSDIPQFVASSRHVSMDAVSVKTIDWNGSRLTVSGAAGSREEYYFAIPKKYRVQKVVCANVECTPLYKDTLLKVSVDFKERGRDEEITVYTERII